MKTLITTLLMLPALSWADREVPLVYVTSSQSQGTLAVTMELDSDSRVKLFKYYPAGSSTGQFLGTPQMLDAGIDIPGLPRPDLVRISTTKGTGNFDPASGGRITVRYFTNYFLKWMDYRFYEIDRIGDQWLFLTTDVAKKPFTRMHILASLAGISEIQTFP